MDYCWKIYDATGQRDWQHRHRPGAWKIEPVTMTRGPMKFSTTIR